MRPYPPPLTLTPQMLALVTEINELVGRLGLSYRPTFSKNHLKPALAAGLIEMTDLASPRSPAQQYRRKSI